MDKDKRKDLREEYNNRHPDNGIVSDDVSDDLYIMLMEYMDEHPEAKLPLLTKINRKNTINV